MNNTVCVKKSDLDQFYTNPEIAKDCFMKFCELYDKKEFVFVEPCAGTGSFFELFPYKNKIGIDLEPKCDKVILQDFFDFSMKKTSKKIATISNPPFGKNCSLAIRFFNKAAEFSDIVGFIIPKTFRKKSVQNKLNLNFKLKLDIELPKNSFILNEQPYDVPCCFQIWEKSNTKRKIQKIRLENKFFSFVKKEEANLAVRRVGGRAGKATVDINSCADVSHYYLFSKILCAVDLVEIINSVDFSDIANCTAGIKSLSKPEFVKIITNHLNKNYEF